MATQKVKNYRRKKKTMHVPDDVIVEIISKLPAKSLLQLRWLSKYWFKVITDPYFVKIHLNNANATNNYPLVLIASVRQQRPRTMQFHYLNSMDDDDEVLHPVHIKAPIPFTSLRVSSQILGSCNGLLCIGCSISGRDKIFIWNPCTKQYKRIIWGDDSVKIPEGGGTISYGFGYDCRIDDYKVIRNVFSYTNGETLVDKYTLGTSSSKKLQNNRFFLNYTSGLFVNGDLYWQARLKGSGPFDMIVAFDIVKEEYRQIAKPAYITHDDQSHYSTRLGKLKGCLCVLNISTYNKQFVEFWVMKHSIVEDMNKEYSWEIVFTTSAFPIHSWRYLKPLMFCKNGEIAMVMNRRNFILYNSKDNQIRCLLNAKGVMEARLGMEVETYIESLVPVNGGTYIGGTSSIATDKPKRKLKRPLRFQDEYK